jgi:hypothetical protein
MVVTKKTFWLRSMSNIKRQNRSKISQLRNNEKTVIKRNLYFASLIRKSSKTVNVMHVQTRFSGIVFWCSTIILALNTEENNFLQPGMVVLASKQTS